MMSPWYLTLLLALGCAGTSRPAAPPAASEENLLLDGLTVISMTGAQPRAPTSILIRGGRIAALYPTGNRPAPAGARVLDLRGRYAIPGLIDAHVHLTAPFVRPGQQDSLAHFFLQGGITAIRDMAGDGIVLRERAQAAGHRASVSPRIFYSTIVASPEFFRTERRAQSIAHGGTPGRLAWAWAIAADSDAAAAAAGAREIGATGIKAYAELSAALLEAASREAHARGLKVWSHATVTPAKPSDAVAAGVDVLSHASYLVLETKDSLPRTYGEALDLLTYDRPASSPAMVRLFSEMQRRGTMLDATLVVARVTFLDPSKNPALAQPPSPRADSFPPELDAYIATALRQWELPGAAVAVVKDGQVVVAKGYGVRELGKPDSVDANTLFDAASLTKSFTAAAIASLVDEKKMAWDAPVRRYLPTLEFFDPYLTANVTIRDLLSHRTGIRRSNSAWYFTRLSRPELLALVGGMEEEAPFRSRLVYWNIGYTIAGEAAAAADGRPWEELVTQRLLVPLGMTRTTAEFDAVPSMPNYASGHAMIGGVQQVTPRETARASTAPAGAIQSSAADLATWMVFQLGDGSFRGRRILSADAMVEMHSPQIVVPTSEAFRAARQLRYFAGYGLGWQVFDYRGNRLLWHSGNGNGQLAYMALLPDLHLGVAVLINSARAGPALNGGIASRIIDHYLGGPTRDYSAELRDPWARNVQRRAEEERLHEASRLPNTTPSLPLAGYTGVFRDRLGLDVRVWVEADTLRLQYGGGETATLVHWHRDTFRARWENPLHAQELSTSVSFSLNPHGEVDRLHMNPFGDDIDARRTTP